MKIIEGTVDEIVEYQKRTSTEGQVGDSTPEPDGNEPPTAVSAEHGLGGDEGFYIKQHVFSRASDPNVARRVFDYLEGLPAGTKLEIGTSERTPDRWSDYLMLRDAGPQRFGAVVYVDPDSGRLTFRLRPEDVADLDDDGIIERNVAAKQKYAIRCMLTADSRLPLARTMTERALHLVRQ